MPWYWIKQADSQTLRHYATLDAAYLEHFKHALWSVEITEVKVKLLNSKQLEKFLLEILKGLEAGLKFQDVLLYISQHEKKGSLALSAQALHDEMKMGAQFNTYFKQLIDPSLRGYCDLFIKNSTTEQLTHHLSLLYEQISQLRNWIIRLQKSLIYPFFVIQLSLIIWLLSQFFGNQSVQIPEENLITYLIVSLCQLLIVYLCQSSLMIALIELAFSSFRFNKLFSLLNASIKAGNHLQDALTILPKNFQHKHIKAELLLVYYHLRLGDSYLESFPTNWFPKESLLALKASCHTGDILRAIESAAHIHQNRWHKALNIVEKVCPFLGLFIAGGFVSKTLISIYLPLLNLS